MTWTIGVDPDLHSTAAAYVQDGVLRHVAIARVGPCHTGMAAVTEMVDAIRKIVFCQAAARERAFDLLVVEGQQITAGKTKNYDDILRLAQVAGAAASAWRPLATALRMPRPQEWKGTMPKHVCQSRAYRDLGIKFAVAGGLSGGYSLPEFGKLNEPQMWASDGKELKKVDWKHIGDAVALAVWGAEQLNSAARIEAAAARGR